MFRSLICFFFKRKKKVISVSSGKKNREVSTVFIITFLGDWNAPSYEAMTCVVLNHNYAQANRKGLKLKNKKYCLFELVNK